MSGIFKAYDIRGIYGKDLNENTAELIGRAFVTFLQCRKVIIGRDIRLHSPSLFKDLARGVTRQGADVIDIGVCSTPMAYYANGSLGADATIMITASHNPGEWNGFKLTREKAIPISGLTGIKDIERLTQTQEFPDVSQPGSVSQHDIEPAYKAHVQKSANLKTKPRVAIDYANAMGIVEARALSDLLEITPLYETPDGSFPNHEANPLNTSTLKDLQALIRQGQYDFGAAFDGDADRVGFVDEQGEVVPMDLITALIASEILKNNPGAGVLYDLRSSRAVKEVILENGGQPHMCRVGHAFIKQQMRDEKAVFAGELSGHYYFRDNFYTESSAMAVLAIANLINQTGQTLSALIQPLQRYAKSEEINTEARDTAGVLRRLRAIHKDGEILELDGLSVSYPDWWFNVRASNTEPLIRLNLEAKTPESLKQHTETLLGEIRAL